MSGVGSDQHIVCAEGTEPKGLPEVCLEDGVVFGGLGGLQP